MGCRIIFFTLRLAAVGICLSAAACGGGTQPESMKAVAALNVPLPSPDERNALLAMLRRIAKAEGMHVDTASQTQLRELAANIPEANMTIDAAIWRGSDDTAAEAEVMDQYDHLGQVWVVFLRGEQPQIARRFRERALQEIRLRWPQSLSLPITPSGGIPLWSDLRRTPKGYIIDPSAISKYTQARP